MELSKEYADTVQKLIGLTLSLPQVLQDHSTSLFDISKSLAELDGTVHEFKQHLIMFLQWNPEKLEHIAIKFPEWHQVIVDQMAELKTKNLRALLHEPNTMLKLYLTQKNFPNDGMELLQGIFLDDDDAYKKVIALDLQWNTVPIDIIENALSDIEDMVEKGETSNPWGYEEFVSYLHLFFHRNVELWLKKLEEHETVHEATISFTNRCRSAIVRHAKTQHILNFP